MLADAFDRAGHEVVVLDLGRRAFDRLPASFRGAAVRGDGTDEDILRRAGAEGADVFIAMTEGDNRNVMAAQLAPRGARRPAGRSPRSTTRSGPRPTPTLGIATLCRTNLMADAISDYLGLPAGGEPGIIAADRQPPGRRAPRLGEPRARRRLDRAGPSGADPAPAPAAREG